MTTELVGLSRENMSRFQEHTRALRGFLYSGYEFLLLAIFANLVSLVRYFWKLYIFNSEHISNLELSSLLRDQPLSVPGSQTRTTLSMSSVRSPLTKHKFDSVHKTWENTTALLRPSRPLHIVPESTIWLIYMEPMLS